ncbi:MAG TPA: tetratricopeptide repeat protein [Blastocatellia bacterium]|nr:tetratricopeptide repeat protein [Blastocatellia bacterium]
MPSSPVSTKNERGKRAAALLLATIALLPATTVLAQKRPTADRSPVGPKRGIGSLTVITGHLASVVFINNIRHGVTDAAGKLALSKAWAGAFPVRVRTVGFADWRGSVAIRPGSAQELKVEQRPTTDQATLHYQKGDQLRDQGKNDQAVEEYKQAIKLNPGLVEARIGLARSLITLQDFENAEPQLQAVLKSGRGPLAEAQTVLANLRRSQGLTDESIAAYRKAIKLAAGVSPEAHIGLAIALEEKTDLVSAVKEYRSGISQDMDTEPILYYLLGNALEKNNQKDQAIEAYGSYLRLDPEGQYASAVESIIKRMKEDQQ